MAPSLRKKIRERFFKERSENAGTPVPAIKLPRPTRLFILIAPLLLWGVALLLWAQRDVDRIILVWHEAFRVNEGLVYVFRSISRYGMPFIVFVFLCYLALSMRWKALGATYTVYLLVILSFGIGGIAGDLLKEVLDRPRPFIEYAGQITAISHTKTPAFPSGHATKSMALALPFVIFVTDERWWNRLVKGLVLSAALAVGYARIVLGAHYPSDVLAGFGVAIAALPLAVVLANRICRRISQEKLNTRAVRAWGAILFFLMLYLLILS